MTKQKRFLSSALWTLGLIGSSAMSTQASADTGDDPSRLRLYAGLGLGFGGELETELDGPAGIGVDATDDLITTIGGQLGAEAILFRFFALGGELRVAGFNTETADDRDIDRSKLIDVDVKPRLRLPLSNGRLELYGALPIGLTVPILSDDIYDDASVDGKVGWNLGVGGGLTFFLTRSIGLNIEPMYVMRWFGVEGDGGVDADLKMRQFTLFANVVFAL